MNGSVRDGLDLLVQDSDGVIGEADHLPVEQLGSQALELGVAQLPPLVGEKLDAGGVVQDEEMTGALCG